MNNIKLSLQEQNDLVKILVANNEFILNSWINSTEVSDILNKYNINLTDKEYYIVYLWNKLINIIINNISEELNPNKIDEFNIISTNFFDFIQLKQIPVWDLVELLFKLKHHLTSLLEIKSWATLYYVDAYFDLFFKVFSKNYNDWILKLLHQYQNAVDNLNIISKINIHWKITYVNKEFCKLTWFDIDEILWKDYDIFIHKDTPQSTIITLWNTIESKQVRTWILKNVTKNNSSYWSKTTIIPLTDSNDNIIEYICIRDDITEIKELSKNLEEYMNALNESTMVLKLDRNHKIIDANELFLHTAWYARDFVLWRYCITKMKDTNFDKTLICTITVISDEMIDEIITQLEAKKTWKWIIKNKDITGNFFWTSTNIIPIMNINDEIVEFVVISTDITSLKIAQLNLHDSVIKLKELDIRKDEFMSISSHELRTPMTAIKWYLSMVIDWDYGKIPDTAIQVLEYSYDNALRVIEIVNNMFDLSKIESGKMSFDITEFELYGYLNKIWEDMSIVWKTKDISFVTTISKDICLYKINTDRYKLNQVIANLITNAFKFTNIWWLVTLNAFKYSPTQVCVEIIDNWIWIPEQELENIFSKFYQVDSYTKRKEEWLWLWLALSQNIMKSLWYEISVSSIVWEWSKFYFYLNILD